MLYTSCIVIVFASTLRRFTQFFKACTWIVGGVQSMHLDRDMLRLFIPFNMERKYCLQHGRIVTLDSRTSLLEVRDRSRASVDSNTGKAVYIWPSWRSVAE